MQLLDALPADNFYKVNGSADSKQYMGKFKGKETGKCQMYVTLDVMATVLSVTCMRTGVKSIFKSHRQNPAIMTIFINSRESGMAESWYQELKQ